MLLHIPILQNMLRHMRTTSDVPDALFAKLKRMASVRGTTLRELTIEGLQTVLDRGERKKPFRLRDASGGKGGLVEGLSETEWERIRELSYEGRGG